jgi:hypothetical protein
MKTQIKPLPILEYDGAERHRIVVQGVTGECKASEWAPVTEAIRLDSLYAGPAGGPFEDAVFTIRGVDHQVLA